MKAESRIVEDKEIRYFVNDNGANIELVKVEPNQFHWSYLSCTIDLYINIYNDDFTKKASFRIVNFNTGIEGGSWFEDDDEDVEDYKEPTEEDSWANILDYFGIDDPYDAWSNEKVLWNAFGKYNELLEGYPRGMYDAMVDNDIVKKCCSCGHYGDEGGVFDFKVFIPKEENFYEWEGTYKDDECRFVEIPVKIGLNQYGTERETVKNILIDTRFVDQYLEISGPNEILNMEGSVDYSAQNAFIGEWLTTMWGCARKGKLIGDYCFGGYDLPDWEDETTLELLGFWKLTDIKRIKIKEREYTVFYSGARYWVVDDEKADEETDFYPIFFFDAKDRPNVTTNIEGRIQFPGNSEVSIDFDVELTSVENNIIEHYYKYAGEWDYFPDDLRAKLVAYLQKAYLDYVKDRPDAIKSQEELNSLNCKYSFPKIEDDGNYDCIDD